MMTLSWSSTILFKFVIGVLVISNSVIVCRHTLPVLTKFQFDRNSLL